MIRMIFPGNRFNSTVLKNCIDLINLPIHADWNIIRTPRSVFGKPSNFTPIDFEAANHCSLFLNKVEVLTAYAVRSGVGKLVVRDKFLSSEQLMEITTVFEDKGFRFEEISAKKPAFFSVLHVLFLIALTAFGYGSSALYFYFGLVSLALVILGIVLMLAKLYQIGFFLLLIGTVVTVPIGLLQVPMMMFMSVKAEEENYRVLQ